MEEPRMPENEAARPIEYKPSRGEALRAYEISIRFLNRGVLCL